MQRAALCPFFGFPHFAHVGFFLFFLGGASDETVLARNWSCSSPTRSKIFIFLNKMHICILNTQVLFFLV